MIVLNDLTRDSRVLREAKTLVEISYQVFVIALHEEGLNQKEIVDGIRVIRVPLRTRWLPKKRLIQLIKYIEFTIKSLHRLWRIRPVICHCHDLSTLPIGYLSKKFFNTYLVYDSHELESQRSNIRNEPNWFRWVSRHLEHFLITKANEVITVSNNIADYLARQDGIKPPIVIRNISENFSAGHRVSEGNHFGFNKDYKIIIFQGGISIGRGLSSLIEAMKFLDENIVLVLIGDGPLRGELQKQTAQLGLKNRVIFKEWVPPSSLLKMTSQADLGVIPYENICSNHYYALPNKFFEYIAAGLPVAVSNFPEMAGLVKKYQIGETFNPDNPKEIVRAVQRILQDRNYYQTLKRNVVKARRIFSWNKEKQKLISLYRGFNEETKK